jgi:hypothetical protein
MKTGTLGQNLKVSALGYGAIGCPTDMGNRPFDKVTNLGGVPEGYRAMNERKSIKVMISLRAGR